MVKINETLIQLLSRLSPEVLSSFALAERQQVSKPYVLNILTGYLGLALLIWAISRAKLFSVS